MVGISLSLGQSKNPTLLGEVQWWRDNSIMTADFLGNRIRIDNSNVTIPSFLDTTRASVGYAANIQGALSEFLANTARRTNKGLLAEPSATNIAPYSEPYSDGAFYGAGHAGATRVDVDWLGVFTKAVEFGSDGSANAQITQTVTFSVGTYCVSYYALSTDGLPLAQGLTARRLIF